MKSGKDRFDEIIESFNIPLGVWGEISEAISYIEGTTEAAELRYKMLKRELMRIWIGGEPRKIIDITCSDGEWFEKIHPVNSVKPALDNAVLYANEKRRMNSEIENKKSKK